MRFHPVKSCLRNSCGGMASARTGWRAISPSIRRVNDIVHGRSAITAPLALRLAKYFGTTPELWMNLQGSYELRRARASDWPRIEGRGRGLAAGERERAEQPPVTNPAPTGRGTPRGT